MIRPNHDLLAPSASTGDVRDHDADSSAAAKADKAALIEVVRRAEAEDPAAQSELVRRYTRRVSGFVRGIIRQPDAIEDVTQMVFIKMFRRLGRLRDPAVFESWLF